MANRNFRRSYIYPQTSFIRRTLVGNKIMDHSDVFGVLLVGSNYILIVDLTPGVNGLSNENRKERTETFKIWDLVCLLLEIWR